MKRFFIVGFCVLSLVLSGFSFADETDTGFAPPAKTAEEKRLQDDGFRKLSGDDVETPAAKEEALPTPPKVQKVERPAPEMIGGDDSLGTSSDAESKKLALALLDAEEALAALLKRDQNGHLTLASLRAMEKSNDSTVKALVGAFTDVASGKTESPLVKYNVVQQNPNQRFQQNNQNTQNQDALQSLHSQSLLRDALKQVMLNSRKNFEAIKNKNRRLLDYSLRNRISLITHFSKASRHMLKTALDNRSLAQRDYNDFISHVQTLDTKLSSLVDYLEGYSKAYNKDGYSSGDEHMDWFDIARDSINGGDATVGRYSYNESQVIYIPTGNGKTITVEAVGNK